jgi:hypothetical protein
MPKVTVKSGEANEVGSPAPNWNALLGLLVVLAAILVVCLIVLSLKPHF